MCAENHEFRKGAQDVALTPCVSSEHVSVTTCITEVTERLEDPSAV
jgi:hypothetical protein